MRSDEKDFVFQGTSIEREEEIASHKKKSVAGASSYLKSLPVWKQEVTDEEGRSRFHGAFTGEYSDEYYNTVGSKEGWAPQSFTSTRKNRAGARKQSISDFNFRMKMKLMKGCATLWNAVKPLYFFGEVFLKTLLEERLANVGANQSLVALDCGSGVGRITKNLLIRYFDEVDLLEHVAQFLDAARENLASAGSETHQATNFLCVPLQEFTPSAGRYDVIWVQ